MTCCACCESEREREEKLRAYETPQQALNKAVRMFEWETLSDSQALTEAVLEALDEAFGEKRMTNKLVSIVLGMRQEG